MASQAPAESRPAKRPRPAPSRACGTRSDIGGRPKLVELRSVQAAAFKHLFEILGCFLEDMNIVLTAEGMEIRTMDKAHVALAHLSVSVASLQHYSVERPIVIGLNVRQINTLMRAATSNDHLHMYIERDNEHVLHLGFESESKSLYFEYKLLDLEDTPVSLPDIAYDLSISIYSADLHKYLRDMAPVGDEIAISVGKGDSPSVTMTVRGDFANGRLDLKQILDDEAADHGVVSVDGTEVKATGLSIVFPMSYLLTFSRASALGPSVTIYLKKDFPVVLAYTFSDMGVLTFMVAPKMEPDN